MLPKPEIEQRLDSIYKGVIRNAPAVAFHKIPVKRFLQLTAETLRTRSDIRALTMHENPSQVAKEGQVALVPFGTKEPFPYVNVDEKNKREYRRQSAERNAFVKKHSLFSHYEIGYRLLRERVLSEVLENEKLNFFQKKLLTQALGEYHAIDKKDELKREVAKSKLRDELGDKADDLINRASQIWQKHGQEFLHYQEDHHKLGLSDMFLNVATPKIASNQSELEFLRQLSLRT